MEIDFKSQEDEIVNSLHLLKLKGDQNVGKENGDAVAWRKTKMVDSRERVSDFSLEMRTIRPSTVFGARRKKVLRGSGYAWTLGSGVSSNSLR